MSSRVLVITGPTASGKTRLGVEIAHRLGSEIVSADSRQVYRGLDIGTGKDLDEYRAVVPPVPVHLVDVADPGESYTVFHFQRDCYRLIESWSCGPRADVPLVMVGGTGLWVEAAVCGWELADVPPDPELRARLQDAGLAELVARLREADPELAARTDTSTARRVVRALEISEARRRGLAPPGPRLEVAVEWRVLAVDVPPGELAQRIHRRLVARLETGLVDEVRGLLDRGVDWRWLDRLGLEYREITAYLRGEKPFRNMVDDLDTAIRRLAKRQRTWIRGMPRRGVPVEWIGPDDAMADRSVSGVGSW
jgi:tRNA dimethylallyltransferase